MSPALQEAENSSDRSVTLGTVPPPQRPDWRFPALVVGLAFFGFLLILGLMFRAGMLDRPTTDREATVIGPVLVLVGTLLTQLLVAAGLVLKHSLDLRTYQLALYEQQRLALEAGRDHQLKEREQLQLAAERERAAQAAQIEEQRLKIDTIIDAVTLLSNSEGEPSSPAQQAGALHALDALGQTEIALALLDQQWAATTRPLESPSALGLIDSVLSRSNEKESVYAASILLAHADKLYLGNDDALIPEAVDTGNWRRMPYAISVRLLLCLAKMCAKRFPSEAIVPTRTVRAVVAHLYLLLTSHDDERIWLPTAHLGRQLVRVLGDKELVIVQEREVRPAELAAEFRSVIRRRDPPQVIRSYINDIETWADRLASGSIDKSRVVEQSRSRPAKRKSRGTRTAPP